MKSFAHIRPAYNRGERISDGVVHIVGIALALLAVPGLVTATALIHSEPTILAGVSVYGIALVLMLTFSALHNMIESEKWSELFRRLDHSGIYVKIAGTYTPFLLMSGVQTTGLLVGLWSSATLGSLLKMYNPHRFRWFGLALYLMMGWTVVWAGQSLLAEVAQPVLLLIITGGLVYTVGVVFFLLDWLPYHNTIWHVCVLVGSILFFAAIAVNIAVAPHVIG
jgi:hemolysin III